MSTTPPIKSSQLQGDNAKGKSVLTKKRYSEIDILAKELIPEQNNVDKLMEGIRRIMNFDPEVKQYTPEQAKYIRESRQRLSKERGVSIFELSGSKASYERRKALKASKSPKEQNN